MIVKEGDTIHSKVYEVIDYPRMLKNSALLYRLLAFGILPGDRIDVLQKAPLGDPCILKTQRGLLVLRAMELIQIAKPLNQE